MTIVSWMMGATYTYVCATCAYFNTDTSGICYGNTIKKQRSITNMKKTKKQDRIIKEIQDGKM